ncbi:MAG: hypothetical protein ACYCPS_01760 [Candidatus Saccharimonadales bacterium]
MIEKIFKKKTINIDSTVLKNLLVFSIPVILYITLISIGIAGEGSQQFSELANSFVHGHTYFLHPIGGIGQDPVFYHGKIYWDEGPFPAIVLMPFVAFFNLFHIFFYQGYIKWLMILVISYILYKMARKIQFSSSDSLIWMFGFVLGSVFIGVASVSSSWLFAQVLGALLALWSLYEYMNKRRWWLIGLLCACLFLTRIPAASVIVLYLLVIVFTKTDWKSKWRQLFQLLVFGVIAIALTGIYNWQRFGSPLDNGNQYQLLSQSSSEARSMGVISPSHIPTNLYTLLLRPPMPVLANNTSWSLKAPWIENDALGTSIFITSPWLLYFFTKRWKSYPKDARYMVITAIFGLFLVLLYFGDGADQLGYRYTLDFMPVLFLALMMIYRKNTGDLTTGMKILLLGSGLTNFYLLASYVK